ncbi:hypothetical protein M8C21_008086 [Ambrosia artemisiifolia]|uniref:peroxidase n=1 Tax=Ambrosia artemisiifolia TaxID=4212 RepID=A0AAD5G365_AMBAR|nr:hypothetical protein M8C21_008086 [Ambrosia artemisiifolia]
MASTNIIAGIFCLLITINTSSEAQLSSTFYDGICPNALRTIKTTIRTAISRERRMAASIIRLHFHDCFVQVLVVQSHVTKKTKISNKNCRKTSDGIQRPSLDGREI